jgi:hypothetical protein
MRFPLPLRPNASIPDDGRPRHHVGTHRRPRAGWRPPALRRPARERPGSVAGRRRAWRRFGTLGVLAWALAVLVGLGGCGPSDTGTGSAPSGSPAAVASPSDSPSDSPTPTAAAAQPAPTTAAPTTEAAAPPQAADPTTPAAQQQQQSACGGDYYINSDGNCVHRPVQAPGPPAGATARCNDGTWSFSQHRSGTCSGHGGVAEWL